MGWDKAFELWWELLNFSFFKMCTAPVSGFFFFNLTTNFSDLLEAWDLAGAWAAIKSITALADKPGGILDS